MTHAEDPWDPGGIINPDRAPQELVATLMLATKILLIHRIASSLPDAEGEKRQRLDRALRLHIEAGTDAMGQLDQALRVDLDLGTDELRRVVHKRLPEAICLDILITAWNANPLDPYEIKIPKKVRRRALGMVAEDLGLPRSWAEEAERAADKARSCQRKPTQVAWFIAPIGIVGLIVALPLAAPLFAASGLAGGAALLSGLATLGGGVMGGLSILTAAGALGSMALTAGAFILGTPEQVEDRVVTLHAMALAKHELRPGTRNHTEQQLLLEMLEALKQQMKTHKEVDDGRSRAQSELARKSSIVDKALKALKKEELLDE